MAAQRIAETGECLAVVCLGCLIRGATPHFEYIASACAHGITPRPQRNRRADGVRRVDDQLGGRSARTRGRRDRRTRAAKPHRPRSTWRGCSQQIGERSGDDSRRRRSGDAWAAAHRRARPRCRCSINAEVGGLTPQQALASCTMRTAGGRDPRWRTCAAYRRCARAWHDGEHATRSTS